MLVEVKKFVTLFFKFSLAPFCHMKKIADVALIS